MEPDSDFSANLIEQVFTLWVEPELQRRGLPVDRSSVEAAIVELVPGEDSRVLLNEETEIKASAAEDAEIPSGTPVTFENFDHIKNLIPINIDINSGWIIYVRLGNTEMVEFEFRYNKARVRELLTLADEYLEISTKSKESAPRPAIDNLYSAAEITVQAQMLSHTKTTHVHNVRSKWLAGHVKMGNIPESHRVTLNRLHKERGAARYGDGPVGLSTSDIEDELASVQEMINFAHRWAGFSSDT